MQIPSRLLLVTRSRQHVATSQHENQGCLQYTVPRTKEVDPTYLTDICLPCFVIQYNGTDEACAAMLYLRIDTLPPR